MNTAATTTPNKQLQTPTTIPEMVPTSSFRGFNPGGAAAVAAATVHTHTTSDTKVVVPSNPKNQTKRRRIVLDHNKDRCNKRLHQKSSDGDCHACDDDDSAIVESSN